MLRSVKNWLTLLFLAVVLLALGLAYLYMVPPLADRLTNDRLDGLEANSDLVAGAITTEANKSELLDRQALTVQATAIDGKINARIVIIDATANAKIVDSRGAQPIDLGEYPVWFRAVQFGTVQVSSETIGRAEYATAAVPIYRTSQPGTVALVVLISAPLSDVDAAVSAVQRRFLIAAALAVAFTLVAGYLASYFIARRLKRIEEGADSIAHGDFSAPIETGPQDEIGQLAVTFNAMGQRLREAFALIAREKESVEVLLDDLAEGVIGATEDDRVAVANPAATQLLGRRVARDADLRAVLPDDLAHALAEVRADGDDRTTVFRHRDLTLEGSVYLTGSETEVRYLIVLRDVTEQARLDQARRDFIATASHELKTPLFSLSGFMELLDEGDLDPEQQREFLALMRQQVDRLTDLSLSLLDLSQVDAGTIGLELADIDVAAVSAAVAAEFQAQAAARDVSIDLQGAAIERAFCDERRLAQVLRALLDNAVKFSPPGGAITVDVSSRRRMVCVTVGDQGPGIPTKDLTRIFERFFRGSANGDTKPGTGLGLSIARDMAELMGGGLTVRSRAGDGSQFTVRVPRSEA